MSVRGLSLMLLALKRGPREGGMPGSRLRWEVAGQQTAGLCALLGHVTIQAQCGLHADHGHSSDRHHRHGDQSFEHRNALLDASESHESKSLQVPGTRTNEPVMVLNLVRIELL